MYILYILTGVAVICSFFANRKKTKKALMIGLKKLWKITPPFISVLVSVAIVLYFVPDNMIVKYLGSASSYFGVITGTMIGSIAVMPGPIVYPLCKILLDRGVSYTIIAAFSSSLMMVGIFTFPIERAYFGTKFAVLRNIASLFTALIIALVFSLVSGKLI